MSTTTTLVESSPPLDTAQAELTHEEYEDLLAEALAERDEAQRLAGVCAEQLEVALAELTRLHRELRGLEVAIGQLAGIRTARAIRAAIAAVEV